MLRFFRAFLMASSFIAPASHAVCNIDITVPSALTPSDNVAWTGCATSGTTIQSALDRVASQGGGAVKLKGTGTVLVRAPLNVGYKTTLYGDTIGTYGMTLVPGANVPTCTPGSYRPFNCPLVRVNGLSTPPAAGGRNAEVWNLKFQGSAGYALTAPAVSVNNSTHVHLTNLYAVGARYNAFEIGNSLYSNLSYVSADLEKGSGAPVDSGGAAGIWILLSKKTVVDRAQIFAPGHYNAGYPSASNPPRDLVAVHGSEDVDIIHSNLKHTNAAAVFVNRCDGSTPVCTGSNANKRSKRVTVWDNDVQYTRQHGLDIAYTDSPFVYTNRISDIGHAGIALAAVTGGEVMFNTSQRTGKEASNLPTQSYGVLLIKWGTNSVLVQQNHLYGTTALIARSSVYFESWFGSPAQTSNTITSNSLWKGTSGWFGGTTAGNTISPNNQY
jgi:hypothetical protein